MPSIMKTSSALALALAGFLGVLTVSGCGDKASQSNFSAELGQHPETWGEQHPIFALQHLENCNQCHGQDLAGGISKVACAECHTVQFVTPGNPAQGIAIHPADWDSVVYARHAPYVRANGTANCASTSCHGLGLQGALGPSCSSCHIGGATQVHPWTASTDFSSGAVLGSLHGDYVRGLGTFAPTAHGTVSCQNVVCHGAQLQGVPLSGPACVSCHPNGF